MSKLVTKFSNTLHCTSFFSIRIEQNVLHAWVFSLCRIERATLFLTWVLTVENSVKYLRTLFVTRQSKGRLYPQFVFISIWLVRWTWSQVYTTNGQEWENRKYKLFDLVWPWRLRYGSGSRSLHIVSMRTAFVPS